jgi:hypothetical protein
MLHFKICASVVIIKNNSTELVTFDMKNISFCRNIFLCIEYKSIHMVIVKV